MFLQQIETYGFRNLAPKRINFFPGFNAFWGENGSGKTSLLEAIHVLGAGRSFRCSGWLELVQFKQPGFELGGQVTRQSGVAETVVKIGVGRNRTGKKQVRFQEKPCKTTEIAKLLPLQVITVNSHKIIESGPEYRRNFIDWAMFHMEHDFLQHWQTYKQALQQRNTLLRRAKSKFKHESTASSTVCKGKVLAGCATWQYILIKSAEQLDIARKEFLVDFHHTLVPTIKKWLPFAQVKLQYQQGWAQQVSFAQALVDSFNADLELGFTSKGPHRADLEILIDGIPAKSILSRGQQKLLVCAMFLARASLLKQKQQKAGIFLLDDLEAELDKNSSKKLLTGLSSLESQVFLTNISRESLVKSLSAAGIKGEFFKVSAGKVIGE